MSAPLAVIILNWNGVGMMERFLPSVVRNTRGEKVRLVVADNGSTDGSADWLSENYPDIEVIRFDRNYGYAGGYDRAIRLVDAEYTLLLNSDVEAPEGWWQPLLEFMESHPRAGAAQPMVLSYNDPSKFEHAGAAGGLIDRLGYPYARGRVLGRVEADYGQYAFPRVAEVAWASGAAMIVRTRAYIEAGGLDERFFAHMEEIDLCWRMRLKGYGVYSLSDSKVFHLGGGALPYGNPRKTYLNFRNNLLMLHKNLPERRGRRFLFRRRLADILGFAFFLLQGKWSDARAVVKAHNDFRKMRKEYDVFPEKDIFDELPGTDRFIYLDYLFHRPRRSAAAHAGKNAVNKK